MPAYLDASAWVKLYAAESGSDVMSAIWAEPGNDLYSSWLGCVEVRAALSRADAPAHIVEAHVADRGHVNLVDLEPSILLLADHFAAGYRLRAGDAIHLATAFAIATLEDAPITMVTADRALASAARACGMPVADPTAGSTMSR